MPKNKSRKQELWQKLKFKYKISATNENTLEEIWRIRTSIFWGGLLFAIFGAMIMVVTAAIIITTPIRNYLPGYLDAEVRDKALQTVLQIENMEQQIEYQDVYIANLRDIFEGVRSIDSVKDIDTTILILENDPKLEKTELEQKFVQNYEEEEMYNLSVLVNEVDLPMSGTAFFKPIKGLIIEYFDMSKKQYGIKVKVGKKETILAALDGAVIFSDYSISGGYTVQIQHSNGFVSIYKNADMLLCKVGDKLKTGEAIGIINYTEVNSENTKTVDKYFLIFELWLKGKPVDPQNYVYY